MFVRVSKMWLASAELTSANLFQAYCIRRKRFAVPSGRVQSLQCKKKKKQKEETDLIRLLNQNSTPGTAARTYSMRCSAWAA